MLTSNLQITTGHFKHKQALQQQTKLVTLLVSSRILKIQIMYEVWGFHNGDCIMVFFGKTPYNMAEI